MLIDTGTVIFFFSRTFDQIASNLVFVQLLVLIVCFHCVSNSVVCRNLYIALTICIFLFY